MNMSLLLSFLIAIVTYSMPSFAGKPSSGGQCKKDRNAKPMILKVIKESSRRIKITAEPGSYLGNPIYPLYYQLFDTSGQLVDYGPHGIGGGGGAHMLEANMEGLSAGASYSIYAPAFPYTECAPISAKVYFSMSEDVPESNLPVVTKVAAASIGFVVYDKAVVVWTTDDTAIASTRMYLDGFMFSNAQYDQNGDWVRFWSDLASNYAFSNGSKVMARVPEAYKGKLVDLMVEISDVFGNTKVHAQKLQL